jgi:hypothetical protein
MKMISINAQEIRRSKRCMVVTATKFYCRMWYGVFMKPNKGKHLSRKWKECDQNSRWRMASVSLFSAALWQSLLRWANIATLHGLDAEGVVKQPRGKCIQKLFWSVSISYNGFTITSLKLHLFPASCVIGNIYYKAGSLNQTDHWRRLIFS